MLDVVHHTTSVEYWTIVANEKNTHTHHSNRSTVVRVNKKNVWEDFNSYVHVFVLQLTSKLYFMHKAVQWQSSTFDKVGRGSGGVVINQSQQAAVQTNKRQLSVSDYE